MKGLGSMLSMSLSWIIIILKHTIKWSQQNQKMNKNKELKNVQVMVKELVCSNPFKY